MSQVEELLTIAVKAIDAASARHVGHTRSRLTPPTDDFNSGTQRGWHLLARQLFINRLPQRLDALGFAGQRGLLINLLRDAQRVSGIELAVEIGIHQ